jgi:hypothetical protein
MNVVRAVRIGGAAGFAGFGAVLLVFPTGVDRAVTRGEPMPPEAIVRGLGARRIVQHLLVASTSSSVVAWASVGTDVLHAASMVAAAWIWPAYRRAELTSAGIALAAAALTALTASGGARGSR